MKMSAEEETVNYIINELEKNFQLKPNVKVTLKLGADLNRDLFKKELKESLDLLNARVGTIVNKKSYELNDHQLYILGFEPKEDKNLIQFMFPYGINIANVLSNTIIKAPKNKNWKPAQIQEALTNIFNDSVNHIVMQEIFKYYVPKSKQVPEVPENILDKIQYAGIKNDDFNIAITFELPVDDIYPPLQKAIKDKDKDIDYNEISLTPLHSIVYNDKKQEVKFVTTLN